jgi:hypothetical protein
MPRRKRYEHVSNKSRLLGLCLFVGAASCAPDMTVPVSRFAEAANTAALTENDFIRASQRKECEAEIYKNAFNFAISKKPNYTFSKPCPNIAVSIQEERLREAVMASIVLYANNLQALAGTDTKKLDENSQTLASNLDSASKAGGFLTSATNGLGASATVVQAISQVADWVVGTIVYKDIKTSAKEMQGCLTILVSTLKNENDSIATVVDQQISETQADLQILISGKSSGYPSQLTLFLQIAQAQNLVSPLEESGLPAQLSKKNDATPADWMAPNAASVVQMNAANANAALAELLDANEEIVVSGVNRSLTASAPPYEPTHAAPGSCKQ